MRDKIINDLGGLFEITQDTAFEFKELYGFTFVFKSRIVRFRDRISSAEIAPAGIIYEEKGQYYFAPLDRTVDIPEIVREYVEKHLKK
ncbi:hypothetical protein [Methanobrevibacter sp.]